MISRWCSPERADIIPYYNREDASQAKHFAEVWRESGDWCDFCEPKDGGGISCH